MAAEAASNGMMWRTVAKTAPAPPLPPPHAKAQALSAPAQRSAPLNPAAAEDQQAALSFARRARLLAD